jgi:hypothetical protein
MRSFTFTEEILAPPSTVFAVLCDVERWPHWTPTMTKVKRLDEGVFAVGSRAQVLQPRLRPAIWTVSELAQDRGFAWVTRAPGVMMRADHAIELTSAGSRVTLSIEVSGLLAFVVTSLYGKLIHEYVNTEVKRLRAHCEALEGGQKTSPNYAAAAP